MTPKKTGFTLFELIIVIIILAIVAKLAVSRWPGNNINLNAEAQQLASAIRYTQSLSMSRGQRYRLNLSASSYSITDLGGTVYFTDPVRGQNTITFSGGVSVTWTNLPNNVIAFDGSGVPYTNTAATTALASTAVISFTNGGYTRSVTLTPQTGRVIVQ